MNFVCCQNAHELNLQSCFFCRTEIRPGNEKGKAVEALPYIEMVPSTCELAMEQRCYASVIYFANHDQYFRLPAVKFNFNCIGNI